MRTALAVVVSGLALLGGAFAEARRAEAARAAWFDEAAREEATKAAALFATLSAHLRSSGGDPRFTDRIQADPAVVAELLADVAFAQHTGRVESGHLVKFDPIAVDPVGPDVAEVRAREFWITRTAGPAGTSSRSDVVTVRYAMRRDGGAWRVADWVLEAGPWDGRP